MGDLLLRIIEGHPGRFVSGEEIGRQIGISRAMVWKQIRTLRRRGFGIEGARGASYRLLGHTDVIEENDVLSRFFPSPTARTARLQKQLSGAPRTGRSSARMRRQTGGEAGSLMSGLDPVWAAKRGLGHGNIGI